jgi:CTP synthase (UTP-ammonia lyase)
MQVRRASIGVIADFDSANSSHAATTEAIAHCAEALGVAVDPVWAGTEALLGGDATGRLRDLDGLWIGPGSPYKNMEGALLAIQIAREGGIPLLGTCGGFQHMILEYARNVLGFADADHEESSPAATRLFVSRLACSLVGRTMTITLAPGSQLAAVYGCSTVREQYRCNYGVNPDYVKALGSGALRIVASDDEGAVRAVELPGHPFFIGTLFLPQHSSTAASPHPLISAFVKACCG